MIGADNETGAHSSIGYGRYLRNVIVYGLLWGWLVLTGCTQIHVIQFNPRKDIRHPVPPPKGWIFEAKTRKEED